MGGEGGMMHAIKSMQYNRGLLKKRKRTDKNQVYGKVNVTQLKFKKSTEKDLIAIREKMALHRRKNILLGWVAFFITLAIILLAILLFRGIA